MTKGEKETIKRLKAMGEEKMFAYIFKRFDELVEAEKQAVVEGLSERIMHDSTCHSGGDPLYTCTCGVGNIQLTNIKGCI